MNEEQERKVLRLAGLGVRARNVVVGVDQVRRAAERNRLRVALVATDASENSRGKVMPLLRARGVPIVDVSSAAALGAAAGRATTTALGVIDAALARGIGGIVKAGETVKAAGHGTRGEIG